MSSKRKPIPKKQWRPKTKEWKPPTEKEINNKVNETIQKFMKHTNRASYQNSWNSIMPVLVTCFTRVEKVKFKTVKPALWGIKRLSRLAILKEQLNIAVTKNDIKVLWTAIYFFILWYNDKNK